MEFAAREMEHIIRLVTGQPLLASSKSCQLLISVIFSRRERRAIEAFEKRSSGGGGVGQIIFHFRCQTHFHCIVVEGGLVKLFSTKIAKMFAKDIPCHIPLFATTLISYHHMVGCFRLARFEAGSILKGKRIKTTRCH